VADVDKQFRTLN